MAESNFQFFPDRGLTGQMDPPYPLKNHECFETLREVKSDVQSWVD
jgi:hypothetical protein